jgi:hypothetical protein
MTGRKSWNTNVATMVMSGSENEQICAIGGFFDAFIVEVFTLKSGEPGGEIIFTGVP